jgi:hypothetical protein
MPLLLEKDNPLQDTPIGKLIVSGDPKKGEEAFQQIIDSAATMRVIPYMADPDAEHENAKDIDASWGDGKHRRDRKGHGPRHAYPVVDRFNGRWIHTGSLSSFYDHELEMLLDPSGDSRERRATLDDFVDQKPLGVIRGGPQGETVEAHEDGHGGERHALVAVDEGVIVGKTLEQCGGLLAERGVVAGAWPMQRGVEHSEIANTRLASIASEQQ